MTPSLGTWERVNADVADKGRSKLVWERQGDSITEAVSGCNDIQGSAVQPTI